MRRVIRYHLYNFFIIDIISLNSEENKGTYCMLHVLYKYKKISENVITFLPFIKENYNERHSEDVVLRCLAHFGQRFLIVCWAISGPSSVLSPVPHKKLTARISRARHYSKRIK